MSSQDRPPVSPAAGVLFGILAVSTASIFIRFAQAEAPSLVIAAYRLTLAGVVLAPFTLTRRRGELRALSRAQVGLALLSGLVLALHFATWISSLEYTTVASSVVLVTTTPLWVALISVLLLRERLARSVWVGLALALAGGVVVGLSDSCSWNGLNIICPPAATMFTGTAFWGDLLALAGAVMAAIYMLIGRRLRPTVSLLTYTFLVYGSAALVLDGMVLVARLPVTGFQPETYIWLAALALVPQLTGHSIFNWALRYISAAFVSVSLLGEPIGSTILAYLFLHETPGIIKIVGAALILVGIYTTTRSELRPRKERQRLAN